MTDVRLRKFPHPFRAMLAISSNVERTSIEYFRQVHRYLNTRESTPMGRGVGLDIADSMCVFQQRHGDFALLADDGESADADELAHYVRTGWIDTLHSYGSRGGDGAAPFERRDAEIAIEALRTHGLRLTTWVNARGRASAQNFGTRSFTRGDVPGTPEFHTDLLLAYGIRYAWNQTAGAAFGFDTMLTPMLLRDGQRLWGFSRHTSEVGPAVERIAAEHAIKLGRNERGEPMCLNWWPQLLAYQLSEDRLQQLLARGQYCVIAQHLAEPQGEEGLHPDAVTALRRLREYQDDGQVLVVRTSRLLEYQRVVQHLVYKVSTEGRLEIEIEAVRDPMIGTFVPTLEQLRGVTFQVPDPGAVTLFLNGRPIQKRDLVRTEDPGGPTVGIRWFAPDTTDQVTAFADAQPVQARA